MPDRSKRKQTKKPKQTLSKRHTVDRQKPKRRKGKARHQK